MNSTSDRAPSMPSPQTIAIIELRNWEREVMESDRFNKNETCMQHTENYFFVILAISFLSESMSLKRGVSFFNASSYFTARAKASSNVLISTDDIEHGGPAAAAGLPGLYGTDE
eukprot:CAMPEP_0169106762 /NCGR_PEP_ID=MMETSP1015-20121227/24517_1 /TAXON_ID=342587 /ORGANISM="Karlodinium micrum, Strain CCMP2283" /LENGTH=113 /DNA_ID=CAMNT_0009168239 /DNA_START=73 /DNA_END=414 /DNA_ORIENTATION=+